MPSINITENYSINAPDVVAEDFNGQIVILNLSDGHYFSLSGIASPIWSALLEGHTPQTILDNIGVQQPDLVAGANGFLDRLLELRLIRPQEAPLGGVRAAGLLHSWSDEAAQIEVFDDLAELIFADPIHDVDEQVGWPAPRPEP
jgi:hypothetical protein